MNPADISILLVYLEQGKLQRLKTIMSIEWLSEKLSEQGIELSNTQKEQFQKYYKLLVEWNKNEFDKYY